METMEELKRSCAGCKRCKLCDTRTNLVFGDGNAKAEVLFVGEGPGEQEDLQGIPFVGPAGKLLDSMLEMIDLDRTRVYIANVVKCRPPRNRDPQEDERSACREYLERQMAVLSPKLIVCLGRIAAQELIGADFRITREHGQVFSYHGVPILATYHPSALLRDATKRPEAFADLRMIRTLIREHCEHTY